MMAKRIDCNATHFRIFASHVVFGDKSLNFIAHGVVDRQLARDRGATRSFRTTTSFKQRTTIAPCNLTHRNGALAFGQWATKSFLHRAQC